MSCPVPAPQHPSRSTLSPTQHPCSTLHPPCTPAAAPEHDAVDQQPDVSGVQLEAAGQPSEGRQPLRLRLQHLQGGQLIQRGPHGRRRRRLDGRRQELPGRRVGTQVLPSGGRRRGGEGGQRGVSAGGM